MAAVSAASAAAAAAEEEVMQKRQPLLSYTNEEVVAQDELPPQDEHLQNTPPCLQQELITLLRKLVGESLACFMVVFTVMAVKVNTSSLESDGAAALLALSVAGGLVTMVTIFTLGHVSGSHINPVVTIAYTLIKHFPLQLAPLYICAQLAGGIAASLVLEVVFRPQWQLIVVTPNGAAIRALLAEGVGGFLLLFVCASVATDTRAIGQFAGLAIGSVIALDIVITEPISGGGLNPARVLGPALVTRHFTDVWIYVVGPSIGGILGALMYLILRPKDMRKNGVHKEINIREATKGLSFRLCSNSTKMTSRV